MNMSTQRSAADGKLIKKSVAAQLQLALVETCPKDASHIRDIVPHTQPTEEVQFIMRNYVSKNTIISYTNELLKLMLFLFDIDPEKYFHDWIVETAIIADDNDKKEDSSRRKSLRKVFRDSVNNVRKNHCPLILETVDFRIYTHYVTTRKSKKRHYFPRVVMVGFTVH